MKICPICKMTVDADNECPFCGNTITYEPAGDSKREKLKFNKYLLLYLLKHCWFSVACLITVIVRLIVKQPKMDLYFILIIFLTACSIIISLFERKLISYAQWKYSPNYAVYAVHISKLLFGIAAVVFSFVMW